MKTRLAIACVAALAWACAAAAAEEEGMATISGEAAFENNSAHWGGAVKEILEALRKAGVPELAPEKEKDKEEGKQ